VYFCNYNEKRFKHSYINQWNRAKSVLICYHWLIHSLSPVLRIRDVYPGSELFHPGSWVKKVPDPRIRIRIKKFKKFLPKKLFLSSGKNDQRCSSRIRNTDFHYRFTNQKFPFQQSTVIQSGIPLFLTPHILKIHSFYLKYFIQVKLVKCVTKTEI
jgi:hypothetical protein